MSEPERLVERSGWGLTRQLLTDACAERAPETVRRNVHSAVDATLATLGVGVATLVSLKAGAMSTGVSGAAASSAAASGTVASGAAVSTMAASSAAVSTMAASSAAVSTMAVSSAAVSVAGSSGVLSAVVGGVVAKAGLAMVLAGAGYYGASVVSGGERTSAPVVSEPSSVAEVTWAAGPERVAVPRARAAGVTVVVAPEAVERETAERETVTLETAAPVGEPAVASVESLPLAEEPRPEPDRPGKPGVARPASRAFSSSLGAELALIRKVRGLVAKGDVAGANSALNTYEEQFPEGSLRPEARQLRAQQVRSQLQGTK